MDFPPMCETLLSFSGGKKKAGIWLFQGLKSDGRKKRRNNSRDRAEAVDTGTPAGTLPRLLLFSSFQPSFLLAASPFLYSPEHFALLSLFSLYPPGCPLLLPQIGNPPLPAHAFPSYFNGLFCLLSFSDPTLSFLFFFLTLTFLPRLWSQ